MSFTVKPQMWGIRRGTGKNLSSHINLVRGVACWEAGADPRDFAAQELPAYEAGSAAWIITPMGPAFDHNAANVIEFRGPAQDFMASGSWTIVQWIFTDTAWADLSTGRLSWELTTPGGQATRSLFKNTSNNTQTLFRSGGVTVTIVAGVQPNADDVVQYVTRYDGTTGFVDFFNWTKQTGASGSQARSSPNTTTAISIGGSKTGTSIAQFSTLSFRIYRGKWTDEQVARDRLDPWAWLRKPDLVIHGAPPPLVGGANPKGPLGMPLHGPFAGPIG